MGGLRLATRGEGLKANGDNRRRSVASLDLLFILVLFRLLYYCRLWARGEPVANKLLSSVKDLMIVLR